MSVAVLNEVIDHEMAKSILPRGFVQARARLWWRTGKEPIHEIIAFEPRKGAAYAGVWGWSLSFCPLLRGKSLKWKRTRSSVQLDLVIDPGNDEGKNGFLIDAPITGYRDMDPRQISNVVARVCEQALREFDRVETLADVGELFEKRSRRKFRGLGPNNYVQTKLAWSLAKRATGDRLGADALYQDFVSAFQLCEDEAILVKANFAAAAIAGM